MGDGVLEFIINAINNSGFIMGDLEFDSGFGGIIVFLEFGLKVETLFVERHNNFSFLLRCFLVFEIVLVIWYYFIIKLRNVQESGEKGVKSIDFFGKV